MIIGLLGILKSGAAYVPLDPSYPNERLAFMLEDSQVPLLLTQADLQDSLPRYEGVTILLDETISIQRQSATNPRGLVKPDNLAYVIYTSGSTGKPKGVMLQHQGAVNFCLLYTSPSPRDGLLSRMPSSA